jgi:pyruvate dehydrogenase E2 component (dihydrolipoamide acetyltransferase)
LGSFGIETFSPVLNLPQTAILGVGNIDLKPVAKDNDIKFIPHITFSLTIDHQVIDGVTGARFLQDLALTISEIERIVDI